jgi:hypothetical protein
MKGAFTYQSLRHENVYESVTYALDDVSGKLHAKGILATENNPLTCIP